MTPKDKKGGLVTTTVFGVAMLIVAVIVALVIVQTVGDASLISDDSNSMSVTNETGGYLNQTLYTLAVVNSSTSNYAITYVGNVSDDAIITSANYTLSSLGVLTNTTETWNFHDVNISYTYSYATTSDENSAVGSMRLNLTDGIDEVSTKIPVILLIVAVVFLFGALVLLISQARKMGGFGGSSGGL